MGQATYESYRHIPSVAAHNSLRASSQRFSQTKTFKFLLSIAAGLSVAGSTETPEERVDPDLYAAETYKRTNAEVRAFEDTFEGLEIVDFEFLDHTELNEDAYARRTSGHGLRPYYRLVNRDGIIQSVLESYDDMGAFNPETPQKASASVYMPDEHPEDLSTTNERVSHTIGTGIADDLTSGSIGVARLVRIDREGQAPGRACGVLIMSENFDSDRFVARFSRIDNLLSRKVHDVADFNQVIANHEFAHCVFNNNSQPTWMNESRADLYAVARQIQLTGDADFAQTWRDLRNLNVLGIGDTHHDTVPMLDRAIPVLLAAQERGELDGLNPEELFNFAINQTAQSQNQTEAEMWDDLELEVLDRETALENMDGVVATIGPTYILDREAAAATDLSALEVRSINRVIESYNSSVEDQFVMQCLVAQRTNGQENEVFARYRENLNSFIATQETPQNAYENIGYRLWQLDDELERNTQRFNSATAQFIEDTHRDETGLTNAEKREILNNMREELAQHPDITPEEPTQEQRGAELSV